jgi:hypothetical protein
MLRARRGHGRRGRRCSKRDGDGHQLDRKWGPVLGDTWVVGNCEGARPDPVVTRYIVVSTPFSPQDVAELSARILEQWDRNGFGPWAAIEKATGRWVGRIGLNELPDWPGPTRSGWSGSSAPPWPPTPPPGG